MKLRRRVLGVAAGAVFMALASTQGAEAQIYDQYTLSIQPRPYAPQAAAGVEITRASFRDLFSPSVVDPDDGIAGPINLPFSFEYNNQVYTQIFVCVNGWISFQNPGAYITNDPYSLFTNARPNLTVAPYFGDHYLRKPGFDNVDPSGRPFTPSFIRYVSVPAAGTNPAEFIVEWENLNVNYRFDPTDPDNPFAPVANVQPQATSVASFQVHLIQAPSGSVSQQGDIEFHYGPVGTSSGTGGIVKLSGASVGVEDEPAVPGGATTFMNAVAFRESGGKFDSTIQSRRLSKVWPPTGFPGQAFVFSGNRVRRIDNWGDGDADLTQLDVTVPQFIRADQRRFVTFIDVIRVLRHTATRDPRLVPFDSTYGRHAFHADVNHNGRFYYSTRNFDNTADSTVNGNLVRYRVPFRTKSTNYQLPFPNDNSFSGFLFDADQQDAALIMLYLAAKLPILPWLPDTLPAFTGKAATAIASDIQMGKGYTLSGKQVEIPVTFNSYLNGALGVAMDAANGTRIIGVKPMPKRDGAWVEAVATEGRVAIAAAGTFQPEDVVATLVVEAADNGDVTFSNVTVGDKVQGVRKFNVSGAVTGATGAVSLDQNTPNPFSPNVGTTIGYSVASDGKAVVRLFDQLGREVKTLVDADLKAGSYQIQWDGRDALGNVVESGVYFCRIEAAGQTLTRAMQVRK